MWPYIEVTITPTIRDVVNDFVEANPDTPSYLDLNPLFRQSGGEAR